MLIFVLTSVLVGLDSSQVIEQGRIRLYKALYGVFRGRQLVQDALVPVSVVFSVIVLFFLCEYMVIGLTKEFGTWQQPYFLKRGHSPIWLVGLNSLGLLFASMLFLACMASIWGLY